MADEEILRRLRLIHFTATAFDLEAGDIDAVEVAFRSPLRSGSQPPVHHAPVLASASSTASAISLRDRRIASCGASGVTISVLLR